MTDCGCCQDGGCGSSERWVAPRRAEPLAGVIVVDKPGGMTSHDVVDAVRRMTGQRKVGHAGTLDPMATGVLVVCLGQATRLAEYLMAGRKQYSARFELGTTTDTYDAEGNVVNSDGRTDFCLEEIDAALSVFRGPIEQIPPMFSALKRDGQPLYKLARQGKVVERPPRRVHIYELVLVDWSKPCLTVEVVCSSGTYIRSLAHDLGQHLGGGAHLTSLVRLASSGFSLEDAVSLDRLEEAFRNGQDYCYLLPPDEALIGWPAMVADSANARRIKHGGSVEADPPPRDPNGLTHLRAYDMDGEFLAVMTYDPTAERWRPTKVFSPAP
ncbi:tRNA pseudouridine(55) synthase TruB [Chloroflexota bacterium]